MTAAREYEPPMITEPAEPHEPSIRTVTSTGRVGMAGVLAETAVPPETIAAPPEAAPIPAILPEEERVNPGLFEDLLNTANKAGMDVRTVNRESSHLFAHSVIEPLIFSRLSREVHTIDASGRDPYVTRRRFNRALDSYYQVFAACYRTDNPDEKLQKYRQKHLQAQLRAAWELNRVTHPEIGWLADLEDDLRAGNCDAAADSVIDAMAAIGWSRQPEQRSELMRLQRETGWFDRVQ